MSRFNCVCAALALTTAAWAIPAAAQSASKPAAKIYVPGRTPWGDPDLQGIYTNKDENGIPFERPSQFDGKKLEDVDDSEFAEIVRERNKASLERAPGIGGADTGAGPIHWYEHYGAKNSRPWLVIDPQDGRIPPITPEAQARAAARAAARAGHGPADSVRGQEPVRSVHLSRSTGIDDAGDLRQLVPNRPGPRLRCHPLRDDSRDARHPARRTGPCQQPHQDVHGRRPRPLGWQHARRRDDQLRCPDRVSRRNGRIEAGRTVQARRPPIESSGRSHPTTRPRGSVRGPSR